MKDFKCILEKVIFVNINKEEKNIAHIQALKYRSSTEKPLLENFIFNKLTSKENEKIKYFFEDYPIIICHENIISLEEYGVKNTLLNIMELAAILEPYRKSFKLENLAKEMSSIDIKNIEKLNLMVIVVNCLLCRLWNDEQKRSESLYIEVKKENINWTWSEYISAPPLFSMEKYDYVKICSEKNEDLGKRVSLNELKKYEKLLIDEKIWSREGFKYTYRSQQENISKRIRENFQKGERTFIEAPTGTGKSFAYILIAAICTYINSKEKNKEGSNFIISTDTKELQNQLIEKDIPNLLKALNLYNKVKYGSIKGKRNYICIERLKKCQKIESNLVYLFLKRLVSDGEYGDIESINYWAYCHFSIERYIDDINCDSDECNLNKCSKPCYLKKRYNELSSENITVVNHSLLASWPYEEKRELNNLIIDEAHNLMEKSYDFFAEEFNSKDMINLLTLVNESKPSLIFMMRKINGNYGFKENIEVDIIKNKVSQVQFNIYYILNGISKVKLLNNEYDFSDEINNCEYKHKAFLNSLRGEPLERLKNSIYALYKVINNLLENIVGDNKDKSSEYNFVVNFLNKLKDTYYIIDKFLSIDNEYARIITISKDNSKFILKNVPLDIGKLINEKILNNAKSVTFLSATLRINNSYENIKKLLDQRNASEHTIEPVFKLRRRTKIFITDDIGTYTNKDYVKKSCNLILEIANKLSGHMLILFNNNNRRDAFKKELQHKAESLGIEIHTSKKAKPLLKEKEKKVVLLGSKSFFEGIDLPGDSLSCVIFDKVPNVNPKDPLFKALKSYKNIDYRDYNYSKVSIRMKQGYGMLIRSIYDYGYFIILDGGNNIRTINAIEKDLDGPNIKRLNSNEIISNIDKDMFLWKKENLKMLLNGMEKESACELFNQMAESNMLFWEIIDEKYDTLVFKNIDNKIEVSFY